MTGKTTPNVGQRIRDARRAARLSQRQLAEIIGVHKDSVSNWETGKHHPDGNTPKIEAALDVSLSDELTADVPEEITLDAALDRLRDAEKSMDQARSIIRAVRDQFKN